MKKIYLLFCTFLSIMFGHVAVAGRSETPSCFDTFLNIMFGHVDVAGRGENNQPLNRPNVCDTSSLSSLSKGNIDLPPDLQEKIDGYNRYKDTPEMRKLFLDYLEAKKNFEAVPIQFRVIIEKYMKTLAENISIENLYNYKNELDEQFRFLELIINVLENTQWSSYAEVMRLKKILEETNPILKIAKIRKEIVFSAFNNFRIDEFFTPRNIDPIFRVDPFFNQRINKPLINGESAVGITDRLTDDEFKLDLFKKNLPNHVKTKMAKLNNEYYSSYEPSLSYSVKLVHLALYNRMIEAKKKLDDCNQKLH